MYKDNLRIHCEDICIYVTHDLIRKGLCVSLSDVLFVSHLVKQVCSVSGPYHSLNALHHGHFLWCCFVLSAVQHGGLDIPEY